jgi:hypothetical protein
MGWGNRNLESVLNNPFGLPLDRKGDYIPENLIIRHFSYE